MQCYGFEVLEKWNVRQSLNLVALARYKRDGQILINDGTEWQIRINMDGVTVNIVDRELGEVALC